MTETDAIRPYLRHYMHPEAKGYPVPAISDANVATLMHHGVLSCAPDANVTSAARAMESHGVHCVLVGGISGERLTWRVLTDADVLAAVASGRTDAPAADVAATEAPTIDPSAPVADAAHLMAEHRVTHLIVADPESQHPVGVIASSDVVRSLALGGA